MARTSKKSATATVAKAVKCAAKKAACKCCCSKKTAKPKEKCCCKTVTVTNEKKSVSRDSVRDTARSFKSLAKEIKVVSELLEGQYMEYMTRKGKPTTDAFSAYTEALSDLLSAIRSDGF